MPKKGRRAGAFPAELGANLRRCREEREMTQRDLSRSAKYDLAQLSAVENGLAVPRADALLRIADALDVSLDHLCGRRVAAGQSEGGDLTSAEEVRDLRKRVERLERSMRRS